MNIKVIALVENTVHLKYGHLEKDKEYVIDESDFGDEIFEKITEPSGFVKKEE